MFTLTINNLNNRYVVVFGRYLTRLAAKDERNLYLDLQRQHPFAFASKTWQFFRLFQFFTTGKQGYRGLVLMSLINYGKKYFPGTTSSRYNTAKFISLVKRLTHFLKSKE